MSLMQPLQSSAMHAVIVELDNALEELAHGKDGVSVCVPIYENHRFLDQTLDSIVAQTVPPLEVLVIDDGSSRENSQYIRRAAGGRGFSYQRITNRGLAAARNAGLMVAQGRGFLPLDADDRLEPTYIEKTYPLLKAGADVVLTGLREDGEYPRNQIYQPGYDRHWSEVTADLLVRDHNRFFYCSLFSANRLRSIGGYNTRMDGGYMRNSPGYEDWTTWVDILKRGWRLDAVLEPLFVYRTTDGGGMLAGAEANRHALIAEIHRHHAQ